MKSKADRFVRDSRRVQPWVYLIALFFNIIVFIGIGMVYFSSVRSYSARLFNENIHNVTTLNAAAANAADTYTSDLGVKIDDALNFIKARSLTYDETVEYLATSNTDPNRQFQLVRSGSYGSTGVLSFGDYSGLSIRVEAREDGSLESIEREIQYGSGYYDIYRSFTDVADENADGACFAPEFTDPDTKQKCFAVYRHIDLIDEAGCRALYTVMLAVHSQAALEVYGAQNEYAGQSSVLVSAEGDYIIKSNDYRNANFYDYIANYNGLSQTEKQRVQADILRQTALAGTSANLYYQNHQGKDCVFSVAATANGWYSITCVPLASFDTESNEGVNYSLIILMMFALLFVIDGVVIFLVGKTMRENIAVAERATYAANEASLAKSRFLSTMSHELRTPLNAIIGLAALSRDSIDDPLILKDYLKKIDVSSKLLLQLISDILDVSAIESSKMKLNLGEFDLTKLLTSMAAIYYDQCAAKGVEFSVSIRNIHSETLIGDSVRVNQVLLNFLSNAVKFTPSGGKVTLSAEQIARTGDTVVIRFCIGDTGCGIGEDLKKRLFLPFERVSGDAARRYSGSGLGLSISKSLAELMNGSVGVESTEGVGSTFFAEIPFTLPSESVLRSFSPIENMRVLVAVANDDEREYISSILGSFGVERVLAATAESALAILQERAGSDSPITLCMLDWKLSDLSGMDAGRRFRRTLGDACPRIMLLAYDVANASAQSADTGADVVFGKPVFPSALYNALEEIASDRERTIPALEKGCDLTGQRILLVEDNALNTEIARRLLGKVGAEVETAENGQLGLERFISSRNGYYQVILMDVQMPILDGYQATRAIRKSAHPQAKIIPILAMTADAFTEDVEKAREAGMNEHISKPVVPEILYAVLDSYTHR